jgi:glycosyltransferase involved in cell wall biosynthesis
MSTARPTILFISGSPLSRQLTGPAIRCLELARQVSVVAEVTVVARGPIERSIPGVTLCTIDTEAGLMQLVDRHAAFVAQGSITLDFPKLLLTDRIKIFDLYDPLNLESLEHLRQTAPDDRARDYAHVQAALHGQLATGDFFLCANSRQRDYWLGMLAGAGRLNPVTYAAGGHDLGNLLARVPMGIQAEAPEHARNVLRGVHPAIQANDVLFIWAGSLLDWFDPLTLIRALAEVGRQRPDVKLFFMASQHPVLRDAHSIAAQAIELSRDLGLYDRTVIFNRDWIPYDERANYLLEADVGVTTHVDHLETYFSFRTRVLDFLWAGLPILTSRGDAFGELVDQCGLGLSVPTSDVGALTQAILDLAANATLRQACRDNVRQVANDFQWQVVARPLVEFCRAPYRAADRAVEVRSSQRDDRMVAEVRRARRTPTARLIARIKIGVKRLLRRRYTTIVFDRLVAAQPPLLSKQRVAQKFRAYAPNLSGLELLIGTFGRTNTCEVILHIDDVATARVNASTINDCTFCAFHFAPIAQSAGREFTFWIESPDAVPGDAITIFRYVENDEIVFKQRYDQGVTHE